MSSKDSFFHKVLLSRIYVSVIPIIIGTLILGGLICHFQRIKYIADMQKELDKYAYEAGNIIAVKAEQSNRVLQYSYISENINRVKSDYDVFAFQQNVRQFLGYVTGENRNEEILIYSSNRNLFNDMYFRRLEEMNEKNEIINKLNKNSSDIMWDRKVYEDDNGIHLKFYRNMPYTKSENIIVCKVEIPQMDGIDIICGKSPGKYLTSEINDIYTAVMKPNMRNLAVYDMSVIFLMMIVIAVLCSFVIFIIVRTTKKVTLGIDELVNSISDDVIFDKNFSMIIRNDDPAEIRCIKNTISSLVQRIKEISEKQHGLEVAVLQKQIDSHTLYNSLSAVKYNAFLNHDTETVELISTLVEYYRASLNEGKNETTLGAEIEMIKKYVYINEISHAKKYNLETEIDDSIKNHRMPNFLLQPIVENCIIHGLAGNRANCKIQIFGKTDGEYIYIDICDNGYGMSREKTDMLNKPDEYEDNYGIKNTYMRLKLVYGENADIKYESKEECGTKVHIKFKTK